MVDVAAEYAGALTILTQFIQDAQTKPTFKWDVCVGVPIELTKKKDGNVVIKEFFWAKKSWIHRLYFEFITLPRLLKTEKYDAVVSLQNILLVKNNTVKKMVLIHQSLQFLDHSVSYLSVEGLKIFLRRFLIGPLIQASTKTSDVVLVQTHWMKQSLIDRYKVKASRIHTVATLPVTNHGHWYHPPNNIQFVYPSAAGYLKNHEEILRALARLRDQHHYEPVVYFTMGKEENNTARKLSTLARKLHVNVLFTGRLSIDALFTLMAQSIVLFPSLIESFGLPLYEAKLINAPIIVKNKPYATEAIHQYPNGFVYNEMESLVDLMVQFIEGKIVHQTQETPSTAFVDPSLVQKICELMEK